VVGEITVNKLKVKEGIAKGTPILLGYLPIAVAFGILCRTAGISFIDGLFFSALVFAGASQFIALNLISVGVGFGEIILTTLLVNFRHFLMSASLAAKLDNNMKKWFPIVAFGVTDEVFSVVSFQEGELTKEFIISLQVVAYSAWVGGTVLGYLVGEIMPEILRDSMGIALYAMFAAILIPEIKKSRKILILAALSGAVNSMLNCLQILPQGWNIILSIVLVSLAGLYLLEDKEVKVYEK
jgi:4-azaleucine resistance transporter AzlC